VRRLKPKTIFITVHPRVSTTPAMNDCDALAKLAATKRKRTLDEQIARFNSKGWRADKFFGLKVRKCFSCGDSGSAVGGFIKKVN